MMHCKQINEQMVEYLYQELEALERERFEAHIQSCARCQQELAAYERTRALLQDLPDQEPPESLTSALLQAAAQPQESERSDFWQRLRESLRLLVMHPAMTAAVTLVVVFGVSFFIYKRGAPPTEKEEFEHLQVEVDRPVTMAKHKAAEEAAADKSQQDPQQREPSPAAARPSGLAQQAPQKQAQELSSLGVEDDRAIDRKGLRGRRDQVDSAERPAEENKQGKLRSRRLARKGAGGYPPSAEKEALFSAKPRPVAPRKKSLARSKAAAPLEEQRGGSRSTSAGPKSSAQKSDLDALERSSASAVQRAEEPGSKSESAVQGRSGDEVSSVGLDLLQRADQAQAEGRCLEALSLYNQAIAVEPELRAKVSALARRCASQLAYQDEAKLRQAREANTHLAGLLDAELRRAQRARQAADQAKKKSPNKEAK